MDRNVKLDMTKLLGFRLLVSREDGGTGSPIAIKAGSAKTGFKVGGTKTGLKLGVKGG